VSAADTVFDAGLQPERTLLAWQRTCLALAVGVAVSARLTLPALGAASIVLGITGITLVALAWWGATRRYRRAHQDLTGADGALGQGGSPMAALALTAGLLAVAGLVFVALVGWPLR